MTFAENILWRNLRDRGVGAKFRRQAPIGRYVADLVCIPAKLVLELLFEEIARAIAARVPRPSEIFHC